MWYGPVNLSSTCLDKRNWMRINRTYTHLEDFFAIWTARFTKFCWDLYYGAEQTRAKVLWASLRWDSVHSWWWLLITFICKPLYSSWKQTLQTRNLNVVTPRYWTVISCLTYEQCRATASLRCVIVFRKDLRDPVFCRCIVRVGNNHIPPALFVLLCCQYVFSDVLNTSWPSQNPYAARRWLAKAPNVRILATLL